MIPYFSYNQIQLGPVTFYPWGFFVGLAFILAYFLVLKQAKEKNIGEKKIFWLAIWIFVGAIIGSRLGYILQFTDFYFKNPL